MDMLLNFAETSWRKLKWMIVALVLPEFLVGRAVQDWMMAWRSAQSKLMRDIAARDGVTWSVVHAFYANMGGFIVSLDGDISAKKLYEKDQKPLPSDKETSSFDSAPIQRTISNDDILRTNVVTDSRNTARRIGSAEASLAGLGDLSTNKRTRGAKPFHSLDLHANARQLISLRMWNLISSIPAISAVDISSKSRSDSLVKATAVGQVLWLFVSTVTRGVRALPISQLEIATLAFSTCAFGTYLFNWHKPQDVQRATFIASVEGLTDQQVMDLLRLSGDSLTWHMLEFGPIGSLRKQRQDQKEALLGPVPNDITYSDLEISLPLGTRGGMRYTVAYTFLGTGTLLASLVFGAVHCAAWNFQFPTETEKTLWRIASLVSTLILMVHPLVHTLKAICSMWVPLPQDHTVVSWGANIVSGLLTFGVIMGYVLARLFLMVEIFRSLYFLPPGAFIQTWSSSVPHIG